MLLLAIAVFSAVPAAPLPADKQVGSAFSAATVDTAVLPSRMAPRVAVALPDLQPLPSPPPTLTLAQTAAPFIPAWEPDRRQARDRPPSELRGPVNRPRAPPIA